MEKVEIERGGNKQDVVPGFCWRRRFLTNPALHRLDWIGSFDWPLPLQQRRCHNLKLLQVDTGRVICVDGGMERSFTLSTGLRLAFKDPHPTPPPTPLCTPLPTVDQRMEPRSAPSAGGGQRAGRPLPPSGCGGWCGERAEGRRGSRRGGAGEEGGEGQEEGSPPSSWSDTSDTAGWLELRQRKKTLEKLNYFKFKGKDCRSSDKLANTHLLTYYFNAMHPSPLKQTT